MKKILVSIILILSLLMMVVAFWLATQSGTIQISKSIELNTSPHKAFSIVSDLRTWNLWSPWMCMEPSATTRVIGSGTKVGDVLSWQGSLVGTGEITHQEITPNQSIKQTLKFIKPYASTADIQFTVEPTSYGVIVTWKMTSKIPFYLRFMTKKMSALVAMDFERGLKMIKDLAETDKINSKVKIKGIEPFEGFAYVGKTIFCRQDEMEKMMSNSVVEVRHWHNNTTTFPEEAFSIYHHFNPDNDSCKITSGFKLNNAKNHFPYPNVVLDSIASCHVLTITFYGHYKHLGNAWSTGYAFIENNKIKLNKEIAPFEIYLNDPTKFPDPADWATAVCIPIKQ